MLAFDAMQSGAYVAALVASHSIVQMFAVSPLKAEFVDAGFGGTSVGAVERMKIVNATSVVTFARNLDRTGFRRRKNFLLFLQRIVTAVTQSCSGFLRLCADCDRLTKSPKIYLVAILRKLSQR